MIVVVLSWQRSMEQTNNLSFKRIGKMEAHQNIWRFWSWQQISILWKDDRTLKVHSLLLWPVFWPQLVWFKLSQTRVSESLPNTFISHLTSMHNQWHQQHLLQSTQVQTNHLKSHSPTTGAKQIRHCTTDDLWSQTHHTTLCLSHGGSRFLLFHNNWGHWSPGVTWSFSSGFLSTARPDVYFWGLQRIPWASGLRFGLDIHCKLRDLIHNCVPVCLSQTKGVYYNCCIFHPYDLLWTVLTTL